MTSAASEKKDARVNLNVGHLGRVCTAASPSPLRPPTAPRAACAPCTPPRLRSWHARRPFGSLRWQRSSLLRNPTSSRAILHTTLIASVAMPWPQGLEFADHDADVTDAVVPVDRADLDVADMPALQRDAADAEQQFAPAGHRMLDECEQRVVGVSFEAAFEKAHHEGVVHPGQVAVVDVVFCQREQLCAVGTPKVRGRQLHVAGVKARSVRLAAWQAVGSATRRRRRKKGP